MPSPARHSLESPVVVRLVRARVPLEIILLLPFLSEVFAR